MQLTDLERHLVFVFLFLLSKKKKSLNLEMALGKILDGDFR